MASSETDITNQALVLLGETPILSMTDDMDVARAANGIYANSRDFVLAQHPWNRCVKLVTLSRTPRTPAMTYDYEYLYPSDCLRLLNTQYGDAQWEVGAVHTTGEAVIWSNDNDLVMRYIFRNTNVAHYSPGLVQTLAAYLAMQLAMALTAHRGKAEDMQGLYLLTLSQSKGLDGQEQSPVAFTSTTLTTDVRLG